MKIVLVCLVATSSLPLKMPRKSAENIEVSGRVSHAVEEFIAARADALGWSESRMVAAVIQFWIRLGCPPISEAEDGLKAVGKLVQLRSSAPPKPAGKRLGKSLGEDDSGTRPPRKEDL